MWHNSPLGQTMTKLTKHSRQIDCSSARATDSAGPVCFRVGGTGGHHRGPRGGRIQNQSTKRHPATRFLFTRGSTARRCTSIKTTSRSAAWSRRQLPHLDGKGSQRRHPIQRQWLLGGVVQDHSLQRQRHHGPGGQRFSIRNNWVVDSGVYGIFPEFGENGLIETTSSLASRMRPSTWA